MIRFLHAADVHLDSPLCGLDDYEGAPVEAIRNATRRALSNLVRLAITERVDFVIFAGDLYDGDWREYRTGLFFVNLMSDLRAAEIPVVLVSGNHDAESRITSRLTLPNNVHQFSTSKPETFPLDDLRVALHGQGFARQAETRNLAADYPNPVPGYFNIGVLHTSLNGREGHEPYAPCSHSELCARGYDYWALGHVHQRESVNGEEHPRIEYPGNLQGRHIRETGAKGCLLVTVDHRGRATPEFRALDVFRWERIDVDATSAETVAEALTTATEAVASARDGTDGRPTAARVRLTCAPRVYREIMGNPEAFRMDLAGQAGRDVWIEKTKLLQAGADQGSQPTLGGEATSELLATLTELRSDPASVSAVLTDGVCGKIRKTLPPEVRDAFGAQLDDIWDRASALLGVHAVGANP